MLIIIVLYLFLSVDVDNVYENAEDIEKRPRPSFSTLTLRKKGKHLSSWTIDVKFAFKLSAICRLNCDVTRTVEVTAVFWFYLYINYKFCLVFLLLLKLYILIHIK